MTASRLTRSGSRPRSSAAHVVICDVSRSVAAAARFLLFLYSLNEVIATLRAYAFSDHLTEISDIIEEKEVEVAIPEILDKIGFRPTDYGQSFADLKKITAM